MDWAARETFCSLSKAFSATRRFVLIPARFIGVFSSSTSGRTRGRTLHDRGARRGAAPDIDSINTRDAKHPLDARRPPEQSAREDDDLARMFSREPPRSE